MLVEMFKKGYYKGQVLAIVLIVMVVVSIIAMAMVSRTMNDSKSTVEERSSSEANQMAEMAIDAFRGVDPDDLISLLETDGLRDECGLEDLEVFSADSIGSSSLSDLSSLFSII